MNTLDPFIYRLPPESVEDFLQKSGAAALSLPIFRAKAAIIPYRLNDVAAPAANIIKQELLSAGGDAVTPAGCVNCAVKNCDILLLGTKKHYKRLQEKLALMPYLGLKEIAAQLDDALGRNRYAANPSTTLADGRRIAYENIAVMGILNLTGDSFYPPSREREIPALVKRAGEMLNDGAAILDIGAESTRPGAKAIDGETERAKLLPAIEAIHRAYPTAIISVDTYRAKTARAAIQKGAALINDISAMEYDPDMAAAVCETNAPIILVHRRGTPETMQSAENTAYADVVGEVARYLKGRADILAAQGIGRDKIILDPGIGFAKTAAQNLCLLKNLSAFTTWGYPILLAASRKSVIGDTLNSLPPEERLAGTLATSCQAVLAGCQIVRVHDVKENQRAIRMLEAIYHSPAAV